MRKIFIYNIILFCIIPAINAQDIKIPINYFKAVNYYAQEKADSAISQLQNCSDDANCVLFHAKILFESANYSGSISLYKSVLEKMPSEASLGLSIIYAEMGFAEESVLWLKKHFENKTPKSYSEINSIKAFENISRSEEWREFWDENYISNNTEKLTEAHYLLTNGKSFEAIDLLNSQSFGTRNYLKTQLLAEAFYQNGNINSALQYIDVSLADNSKNPNALRLKAKINKETNNFQTYFDVSLKLLNLEIYNPENLFNYAEACLLLNKQQEALTYINIYLDCFPENEKANFIKVQIFSAQKDYRNALIGLNKLIEINPSDKEYFILRGDTYFLLESWKFASDDYSMALDIYPFLPKVYLNLGVCLQNLDFNEKACHAWRKAASLKNREAAELLFRYCGG